MNLNSIQFSGELDQGPSRPPMGNTRKKLMACVAGTILSMVGTTAEAEEPKANHPGYSCKADPDCERQHLNYKPSIDMDEKEQNLMESTQKILRENYTNPTFLNYLQKTQNDPWTIEMNEGNRKKSSMAAIELTIEHADELLYTEKRIGTVEITKRAYSSDAIPNNFKIVVENGSVVEINGKKLNPKGWLSPKEIARMHEETQMKYQVCHEIAAVAGRSAGNNPNGNANTQNEVSCEYQPPTGNSIVEIVDREFMEAIQIHLPHHINKLLELKRNSMGIKEKPLCPSENKDENEALATFSDATLQGFAPIRECAENQPSCAPLANRPEVRFQKNGTETTIEILDVEKRPVTAFGFDGTVMTQGENPQEPWVKPEECNDSLKRRYLEKLKTPKKK